MSDTSEQLQGITAQEQGPGYPYYKEALGSIALSWLNTEVITFSDPKLNFVKYKDDCSREYPFKVPGDVIDELGVRKTPRYYYPSTKVYEYWTGKVKTHTPATVESPEVEMVDVFQDAKHTLHYLNARLRTFSDVPEANYIEYLPPGHAAPTRFLASQYPNVVAEMFFEDYPICSLPLLQMDHHGFDWYAKSMQSAQAA